MPEITKVTYWQRCGNPVEYKSFTFKHMWPWVFIKLLYIRLFYDEMEMEEE